MRVRFTTVATGVAASLAFLAAVPATSAQPATRAACVSGVQRTTIGGKPALRFCGPARATLHLGSQTIAFSGGRCIVVSRRFTVNLGAQVLALGVPMPNYFGITTQSATPGPQSTAAVAVNANGHGYVVTGKTVNLAPGLRRGTFGGTTGGMRVRGSFTC